MTTTEQRLDEIRNDAAERHKLAAPLQTSGSYYGQPLLKPPVWTWEVPLYFFAGGAAGGCALIAAVARITGADARLVRDARRFAAIGATVSGPLLIADLGRPERFLYMLRVFKPQSPMSVGAWILAMFGASSTAAVAADELSLPPILADLAGTAAALSGLGMATYTGVLLGATAIPAWSRHVKLLPLVFGASGLASAVSLLQLRGHDAPALNAVGIAAAACEMYAGTTIDESHDATPRNSEELRGTRGTALSTMSFASFFSGALPLVLRVAGLGSRKARDAAAASSLLGSLLTRIAWVEEGKTSARNFTNNSR